MRFMTGTCGQAGRAGRAGPSRRDKPGIAVRRQSRQSQAGRIDGSAASHRVLRRVPGGLYHRGGVDAGPASGL